MALSRGPRIVTDGLVLGLDASDNNSLSASDLPVKSGLVMWMDAADDSTFSYSSGTTVSQWRDKSPSGYHMTPVSAGPTRNAFNNSRKVLAFTTAQDIQNLTIDLRTSAYSIFVVSRYTNASSGTGRILTSSSSYNNWLLGHWASETNKYYANGWVYSTYVALDTNWKLYLGDWGGPSNDLASFYGAGTAITTNSADASAGPWTLGVNANAGERSNCEAAEIIVYNRLLSAKERKLVHTYLGVKWGISNADRSIIDITGNNNDGLLGNGTAANMPAVDYYNKNTFKFDGSNDYIKLGTSSVFNQFAGDFSVSLWAKANALNSNYGNLIGDWYTANTTTLNEWQIMMNNTSTQFRIYRHNTGIVLDVASGFSANTWINVVLTRIGSTLTLYANNNVVGTATNSSIFGSSTGNVNLGVDGNSSAEPFSGNIANVLIYNRGLTAAQVLQNYNAQKSKFDTTIVQQGLVFNLDAGNPYSYAGAGTTWYDTSGNGYNGTLTSNPVYSTDSGGAFTFAGNYSLSPASTVNSLNGDALTVEAWIKHDSFGAVGTGRGYVSNWHSFNTLNQRGFILRTYDTQTYPTFWWCWGGGNNYDAFGPSSYVMQTGRIYHVVATYEKNVAVKIYVNGNLEGTGTNSVSNTIAFDTTNGIYVGFSNINNSYMYGNIYSTRLYNRVLSAAQVLQNYNATKSRFGY